MVIFFGSGYSARPGQIVPRGYSTGPGQIVHRLFQIAYKCIIAIQPSPAE